ncbi:variant surface glycoprotein [Echinococcus multilocularis]|uniref:Variant surface glycoprotein n=1 Tax=Echinococcus multilocularis TaxID=6211 RepID=A0A0S4MM83_ECHMU|nr:variant surface glycoprotein [Echinococcus multilocularis]CUT99835.1 variant surface glycoprotein [Echinococcus multilocularis]CUT99841.1 variant surface glycoprotein [Echinococcus multilocularis]
MEWVRRREWKNVEKKLDVTLPFTHSHATDTSTVDNCIASPTLLYRLPVSAPKALKSLNPAQSLPSSLLIAIAITIPTRIITSRPLTFLTPPHLDYPQYQFWRLASGATMTLKGQKNMAGRRRVVKMQASATTTKNECVNAGPQQGRGIRSLTHWWTMLSSAVQCSGVEWSGVE